MRPRKNLPSSSESSKTSSTGSTRKRRRSQSASDVSTPSSSRSSRTESIPSSVVALMGSEKASGTRIESHIKNIVPYEGCSFTPTDNYEAYAKSTYDKRKEELLRHAFSIRFNEMEHRRTEHAKLLRRIEEDEQLRGYLKYRKSTDLELRRFFRVLGQRSEWTIKTGSRRVKKQDGDIFELVDTFAEKAQFNAPRRRILITSNISKNKENTVPVYSDIPNETLESLDIPKSLLYTYKEKNVINGIMEHELADAIEMSKDDKNKIVCTCCSSEPVVPCFENEDCPCYRMNRKLKDLQPEHLNGDTTNFLQSSFGKVVFNISSDQFYNYAGFGCSDECDCKGRCTNNPLFLIEKRLYPLEIYRSNKILGFCIRSPVMIPGGTAIMEFVGDVVKEETLVDENRDYTYQISYPSDHNWKDFLKKMKFTKEYKDQLLKLAEMEYFIDPKWMGNIARTAGHSCSANMEVVRIYQKSLSPAHIRLVMITLEDVYPGVPLTIDYGIKYMKKTLKTCLCGTFGCYKGEHFAKFVGIAHEELGMFHSRVNYRQCQRWSDEIVMKLPVRESPRKKQPVVPVIELD